MKKTELCNKLPAGFRAAGISCGIKKSGKKDLGLLVVEGKSVGVCFFTSSAARAAPLVVGAQKLALNKGKIDAVVVNSGNANCFTGKAGENDAVRICARVAKELKTGEENVLPASTGIIGKKLPFGKMNSSIGKLTGSLKDEGDDFARSIRTTDTFPKISCRRIKTSAGYANIYGVAKGSGMIYPNLLHATMLGFIMTDASLEKEFFTSIAKEAIELSFNSLTVDGCMSTNDSVFFLSSSRMRLPSKLRGDFKRALIKVCVDLAKMIAYDGEGATKYAEIEIRGAKNKPEAKHAAFAIANSNLFKCALYGEDPNWGRIFAALGQAGVNPSKMKIDSTPLGKREVKISINLNRGRSSWTVYTTDLTHKYIDINTKYN